MPVNFFMTAKAVAKFSVHSLGTAVFIVPTVTSSVHPTRRVRAVAAE